MAFFINVSGLMLFKPFGRSFTGHADVKTFQDSVKLWIG